MSHWNIACIKCFWWLHELIYRHDKKKKKKHSNIDLPHKSLCTVMYVFDMHRGVLVFPNRSNKRRFFIHIYWLFWVTKYFVLKEICFQPKELPLKLCTFWLEELGSKFTPTNQHRLNILHPNNCGATHKHAGLSSSMVPFFRMAVIDVLLLSTGLAVCRI